MNKIIKAGIFALAIVMTFGACSNKQQDSLASVQEFSFPPIIDLSQYVEDWDTDDAIGPSVEMMQIIDLNNNMEYDSYIYDYLDKIEVIVRSRNSLIAYIYADDGGGYGGVNYCFAVLNTIDDSIVDYDSFNSLDVGSEAEINEYMLKWNSLLEKHNISEQVINPTAKADNLSRFPFENYQCIFDYDIIGDDTVDWRLLVYDTDNSSILKVVTQQTSQSTVLRRIRILGYHKSPYENRIAIFVSLIFGFSGNILFDPMAFGYNMNVGFN